jgi:hypothetical protein
LVNRDSCNFTFIYFEKEGTKKERREKDKNGGRKEDRKQQRNKE